jgi:hypothetical protein
LFLKRLPISSHSSLGYLQSQKIVDNTSALYHWCRSEALSGELAWNCTGEQLCGRPLGLRLLDLGKHHSPLLFILDAYHGMFQYDLTTSMVTHLFDASTPQFLGDTQLPIQETYKPRFFNDFDIQIISNSLEDHNTEITSSFSPSLLIYFTDTSYLHYRCQNRQAILDGAPTGRLFLFDTSSSPKHFSLLISSLHFPNGIQFLSDSQTLLLAESSRFRIISVMTSGLQIHLKTIAKEESLLTNQSSLDSMLQFPSESGVKIYLSSVPGFIDNIRHIPSSPFLPKSLPRNSPLYTLSLGTLSCKPFSLLYLLYQSSWLRIVIRRILPMRYLEHTVPAYGYVAILSESSGVVETYQDPTGRTPFISQGNFHPLTGDLWLGSHSNKFLGVKSWRTEDQS